MNEKIKDKFKRTFPDEVLRIFPDSVYDTRAPHFEIYVSDAKPANPKMRKMADLANEFDFACSLRLDNSTLYQFDLKSAAFDEFLPEFAKRFGLQN